MANVNVTLNSEKNGVEIRFDGKPEAAVIESLKANGFRWSGKQKMWYAKQTDEVMAFVNTVWKDAVSKNPCGGSSVTIKNKTEKHEKYNLFEMTRTEGIENNYELYKIHDTKEIAAIIRKHIRARFPMCKFSVTSDYHSIHIDLLASPFAKDSEEVKAIVHYVFVFAESYNYDNSDSMTDYFDVNFYGVYESSILSYKYEQTEQTEVYAAMSEAFAKSLEAYNIAKAEREAREYEERRKQMEIDRAESARLEEIRKANHEVIENNIEVVEVDYFALNALYLGCQVNNPTDIDESGARQNCRITKEVRMTSEIFELYTKQMMSPFSFYGCETGGSYTDDRRVKSIYDYERMSDDERKTVEFYNMNCVAIVCDGEIKYIVNSEGHDYGKYTYTVDSESQIVETYTTALGINEEEYNHYKELAESIEDMSADVIISNDWHKTWNNEKFYFYKIIVRSWIEANNFEFNIGVVRAIENDELKLAMYRILTEPDDIKDQFANAFLSVGQKITIVRMSDLGGVGSCKAVFKDYEFKAYAQYDNAVKIIYQPEGKRNDYYQNLYNEVIIYDGWVDIPRELFWESVPSSSGLRCERTKFLSFDRGQFDVVLDYFKKQGIKPIINTYKPVF